MMCAFLALTPNGINVPQCLCKHEIAHFAYVGLAQCDAEGLRKYLIDDKQFAEERVNKAIERLQKCKVIPASIV